jgi:hypothetical protein
MDQEFGKWLVQLGIGGGLAALMFAFYRKDSKEWRDAWKGQSEALLTVVKENTQSNTAVIKSVEANTRMVESMHIRLDRVDRGRRMMRDYAVNANEGESPT